MKIFTARFRHGCDLHRACTELRREIRRLHAHFFHHVVVRRNDRAIVCADVFGDCAVNTDVDVLSALTIHRESVVGIAALLKSGEIKRLGFGANDTWQNAQEFEAAARNERKVFNLC